MKWLVVSIVALFVSVIVLAHITPDSWSQPAAQPKVVSPDQIKDCSYWTARIADADRCYKENLAKAGAPSGQVTLHEGHCANPGCDAKDVGTTKRSSSGDLYYRAAMLCKEAIPKYYAEKAKCDARQQGGMPATAGGPVATTPPGLRDQLEALKNLADAVSDYGRQKTQQNLTAIKNAFEQAQKVGAYSGSSYPMVSDPLEQLGLEFMDLTALNTPRGDWDMGPWFGEVHEVVPPNFPGDVMTPEQYCRAWLDADNATCDKKVDQYFSRPPEDSGRIAEAFQASFGCEEGYARKWCKNEAYKVWQNCVATNGQLPAWGSNGGPMLCRGHWWEKGCQNCPAHPHPHPHH